MIGYTTVGTNDLAKSAQFYDALFSATDANRVMEEADYIVWGRPDSTSHFSIHIPADGNTATVGNGVMIGLKTESPEQVERMYHKAIELGAKCEGKPGPRGGGMFYAAYFRDLDGNKLNFHCFPNS
ncbi:MAG: VOC family protein [Kordiimonas sp.]